MSPAKVLKFPSRLLREYLVRLDYREPSLELHTQVERPPFTWTYRVVARTEEAAIANGLAQFREMEALSSVGWGREICGVHAELAKGPAPVEAHPDGALQAKGIPVPPGDLKTRVPEAETAMRDKAPERGQRIRCPRCAWQPRPADTWQCTCLHVWNTFDTRGKCPNCSLQWHVTQCLKCQEHSPHEDWYEKPSKAE